MIASFDDWDYLAVTLGQLQGDSDLVTPLVVDHGRSGHVAERIDRVFPAVEVVRASPDLWWTGATNAGIEAALAAGCEGVILLNSDCSISLDDLHSLVMASQELGAIVAPVQRDAVTGEVLAGRAWPLVLGGFPTLWTERRRPRGSHPVRTRMIIGGRGAVLPRRVLEHVGLFAADALPHYLADHDFYLRCTRAGERLYIHPACDVLVDRERTTIADEVDTWADLRAALGNPRSHRNLGALSKFFRRNYPVSWLWPIGLGLNVGRLTAIAALRSARRIMLGRRSRSA